jgi:hypothetical protein
MVSRLPEPTRAAPFPPPALPGFCGTMRRSDFLAGIRLSRSSPRLISRTALCQTRQDLNCPANASPIANLAKLSDPGRAAHIIAIADLRGVACCAQKRVGLSVWYDNFRAQSLQRIVFGSVAPRPTLKPNVAASAPRTGYGRLAGPCPTGLCACYALTVYKGNQLPCFLPVE